MTLGPWWRQIFYLVTSSSLCLCHKMSEGACFSIISYLPAKSMLSCHHNYIPTRTYLHSLCKIARTMQAVDSFWSLQIGTDNLWPMWHLTRKFTFKSLPAIRIQQYLVWEGCTSDDAYQMTHERSKHIRGHLNFITHLAKTWRRNTICEIW